VSRHSASIAGNHPDAPRRGAMSRQRRPQAGRTGCALTGLRADWLAPQHPRSQKAGAYSGQACAGGRSRMSAPLADPAGRGAGLCVPEVCGSGGVRRRTEGAARALVRGPPGGGRVPIHGGLRRPLPCLTAASTMPPAGRIVGRRAPRRRRARARLAARLCAGAGGPRRPRWPRGGGRRGLSARSWSPPRGGGQAPRHAERDWSCAPRWLAAACQRTAAGLPGLASVLRPPEQGREGRPVQVAANNAAWTARARASTGGRERASVGVGAQAGPARLARASCSARTRLSCPGRCWSGRGSGVRLGR